MALGLVFQCVSGLVLVFGYALLWPWDIQAYLSLLIQAIHRLSYTGLLLLSAHEPYCVFIP